MSRAGNLGIHALRSNFSQMQALFYLLLFVQHKLIIITVIQSTYPYYEAKAEQLTLFKKMSAFNKFANVVQKGAVTGLFSVFAWQVYQIGT